LGATILAALESLDLVLVRATRARRVLEIGFAGLDVARRLPPDGQLIIVEANAALAIRARDDLGVAGMAGQATVIVGDPSRYLHKLAGPFDLVIVRAAAAISKVHGRVVRLLGPGATLLTLNLTAAEDYNDVLLTDARLSTAILNDGDVGVSVRQKDSA
jgi:predicted O-methyltransferase YrrM